ncbi:endonuclease/exonuclease/phosphatase family protein [Oceanobacter mangrovi]|uniref:endonuclease/exonuclease/phosphatase family protein n=1 Tax=Oceanobacter mangrovi TaxID=2862510 RepID=UPI001C8E6299|nr:endonuclease/exonuclease/phosphatase family protein [Oceanobacter mangrovi]
MKKIVLVILLALTTVVAGFFAWVWLSTWHPAPEQVADIECSLDAPVFDHQQPLKVMSYNVQFFAGKNYVFYYDLPNNAGPDDRPAAKDIAATLKGIAGLIQRHHPDVVLLQEVHDGAAATDHRDQLAALMDLLPSAMYPCQASAWYWKADFIPHPRIMGSVGMKLVTLSRYRLEKPVRYQLPQPPMDWVSSQFYLKRALLDVELPTSSGTPWHLINTHFDAFAQGSDTMQRQALMAAGLLSGYDNARLPFVFGGDLNLLMPGQYAHLQASQQYLYDPQTELEPLLHWPSVPSLAEVLVTPASWYTHYPNDPDVSGPDRTIDYLFYSRQLERLNAEVDQSAAASRLSDHLPLIAVFTDKSKTSK